MQPWTEAYADIVVGLGIIVAVAAVFAVGPLVGPGRRRRGDRTSPSTDHDPHKGK